MTGPQGPQRLQRSQRPRGRRVPLLIAGVLLLPVLEIAVAIQVGQRIGAGWTVLGLLALSACGLLVLRTVGTQALRALRPTPVTMDGTGTVIVGSAPASRPPGADAAVTALAGVLLLVPGFLTAVAGLVLLLPPVRRAVAGRFRSAVRTGVRGARPRMVVRGEAVDVTVLEVRDDRPPTVLPPGGTGDDPPGPPRRAT